MCRRLLDSAGAAPARGASRYVKGALQPDDTAVNSDTSFHRSAIYSGML